MDDIRDGVVTRIAAVIRVAIRAEGMAVFRSMVVIRTEGAIVDAMDTELSIILTGIIMGFQKEKWPTMSNSKSFWEKNIRSCVFYLIFVILIYQLIRLITTTKIIV